MCCVHLDLLPVLSCAPPSPLPVHLHCVSMRCQALGDIRWTRLLTFTEHAFRCEIEGEAFGWQASKQQIYQVLPFAMKKMSSENMRERVWGYF